MILNLLDKFKQALDSFELQSPDSSVSDHQDSVKLLLSSNYKCLTPDDIVKEQSGQTTKVSQVYLSEMLLTFKQLSLPAYVVRPLLRSFGYSSEDFIKEYKKAKTENRVPSLFEKVGLPYKEKVDITLSTSDYEKTYECSSKKFIYIT